MAYSNTWDPYGCYDRHFDPKCLGGAAD